MEVMMRRLIAVLLLVLGFARGAEALTLRDLMELSKAGLGDEVLLALIEVHRGVYAIDPATLRALKDAGVSDRVIAALIRSGREAPAPEPVWIEEPAAAAPAPVVVIEHHAAPQVQQVAVPVPVPVFVAVPTVPSRHRPVRRTPFESTYVPFQTGPPPARPATPLTPSPVYWGFGGKLRPDAWGQPAHATTDPPKDRGRRAASP
jgi:hypothetical protein